MQEFLGWFHESPGNFWKTVSGLAATFLLGFFLTFILPSMAKASALSSAEAAIIAVKQQSTDAGQEYAAQEKWFAASYVNQLPGMFQQVQEDIGSADASFVDAQSGSVDECIEFASQAKQSAEKASSTIGKIWEVLNGNTTARQTAMTQTESLMAELTSASMKLDGASGRYTNEHNQFLLRYTDPMATILSTAGNHKATVEHHFAIAHAVMPPLIDVSHTGDPNTALQNLDVAKTLIDEMNTLAGQVTAGLDYQREAAEKVQSTIGTADAKISDADRHMSEVSTSRGYTKDKALKVADESYRRAVGYRDQAKLIMATPIAEEGGKFDAPAAYEAAKQAISEAVGSYEEVDRQVGYEDAARAALASYQSALSSASGAIAQAERDELTLERYHASDVWFDVSGSLQTANANVLAAENHKRTALTALDLSEQRLADASIAAQNAINALNDTTSLAQAVTSRASYLEGYRNDWPSARSNAQSTIDGERSEVNSYGSYDTGARSDFNTAVSLLDEAIKQADSWHYEPAVNDARQAASLASGTGNRAHQAYDEEQDRLRREEEERERQEQELIQSQNNSDSGGGGYDYDGGDSSCCDGGGSDYGGGDGGGIDSGGGGDGGDW